MDIQALARERTALLQWLNYATGHQDPRSATRLLAVLGEGHGAPASAEAVLQELPALQQLMLDGSRLLSLAAVCYCRALTHLSVAACQLSDLEGVGACAGLQQLHAPHNDITDLAPLAGLPCLAVLDLSHNAVADPDMLPYLADCPALDALDLSANPARFTQQQVLSALPQVTLYGGSCAIEHSANGARLSSDMTLGSSQQQQQQLAGSSGLGLYWRKMRVEALASQDTAPEPAAIAAAAATDAVQGSGGGGPFAAAGVLPGMVDEGAEDGAGASSSQLTHGAGALLLGGAAARGLRRRQQQVQQQQQAQQQQVQAQGDSCVPGAAAGEQEEAAGACEVLPGAGVRALVNRQQSSSSSACLEPSSSSSRPGPQLVSSSSSLEGMVAGGALNPLLKGGQPTALPGTLASSPAPAPAAAPSASRPTTGSSVWLNGRPSTASSVASSVLVPGGSSLFGLAPRGAPSEASRPPSQQAALLTAPDLLGCGPQEPSLLGEGGSSAGSSRPSTAGGWDMASCAGPSSAPISALQWRGSSRGSQGGPLGLEDSSSGGGAGLGRPLSRSSSISTSGAVSRLGSARPQPPGVLGLAAGRSGELEQPPVGTWALKQGGGGGEGQQQLTPFLPALAAGGSSSSSSSQGRVQLPRIASARGRP